MHAGRAGLVVVVALACSRPGLAEEVDGCADALAQARRLNAAALFQGSAACLKAGRDQDGALLLLAGQTRAIVDLSSFEPQDESATESMAKLYGYIYFQAGGGGPKHLYQDSAVTEQLLAALQAWEPELLPDHDPGWAHKGAPTPEAYARNIALQRTHRIAQLRHYALLVRDPEYQAAEEELSQIRSRAEGKPISEPQDVARSREILRIMDSVSERYPRPEPPEVLQSVADLAPSPDATFSQRHTGFDGPKDGGLWLMWTREEARESWLPRAMGKAAFDRLIADVDFGTQFVVAIAAGERTTATGGVVITNISAREARNGFSVSLAVGVMSRDCHARHGTSHPFAVAVAPRPTGTPQSIGHSTRNFAEGCKPAKRGKAVDR